MGGNLTGMILGGRYQIGNRIGMGGMAEVYRGQDTVLGRTVAIKVMLPQYAADPAFTQRFRQEAASAANLQNPYIVNVYDWGYEGETYFIIMEYVRGTDLKTAIVQRGPINQRKVAEIGSQVCQALSVAHHQDIVHRDIKPQNIMVQPDGNVKVMDFGIARAKNSVMNRTSSVLGTAHYISPEQAQGKELTAASDIYSLGVVLYEAVTGKLPFDGPDAVNVALQQLNELPVPPSTYNPSLSPDLEDIILTAMEKNPADRFATANDMRMALNDFLAGRPVDLRSGASGSAAATQVMGRANGPAVIGAPAARQGGMGTAATRQGGMGGMPVDGTQVMPNVGGVRQYGEGRSADAVRRNGSYRGYEQESGVNKKVIIGVVAAVIAVVVIGIVVFMTLSSGNSSSNTESEEVETIEVPTVVGYSVAEATTLIENAGFELGDTTTKYDATVEAGKVISQSPSKGMKAEKGSKINLVVSQGTEQVEVPDLKNMTATEAKKALAAKGLAATAGTAAYSDTIDKDKVMDQSPAANTKVDAGATVTYVLSLGVEKTEVPNVVGMTEGAATVTLENAGFKVTTGTQESADVAAGTVISQTPEAGSSAKEGDSIYLLISAGKKTVSYTVAAYVNGAGGSVSPSEHSVEEGGSCTFTITSNEGCTISSVADNHGTTYEVDANGNVTVSNVSRDLTLMITFQETPVTPEQSATS